VTWGIDLSLLSTADIRTKHERTSIALFKHPLLMRHTLLQLTLVYWSLFIHT